MLVSGYELISGKTCGGLIPYITYRLFMDPGYLSERMKRVGRGLVFHVKHGLRGTGSVVWSAVCGGGCGTVYPNRNTDSRNVE